MRARPTIIMLLQTDIGLVQARICVLQKTTTLICCSARNPYDRVSNSKKVTIYYVIAKLWLGRPTRCLNLVKENNI